MFTTYNKIVVDEIGGQTKVLKLFHVKQWVMDSGACDVANSRLGKGTNRNRCCMPGPNLNPKIWSSYVLQFTGKLVGCCGLNYTDNTALYENIVHNLIWTLDGRFTFVVDINKLNTILTLWLKFVQLLPFSLYRILLTPANFWDRCWTL